jgi:predicted metalloprotease
MTSKGEGAGNRIQITDGGGPTDDLVASAIIDVQAFWAKEMPQIFNTDYKPISGAYAVSPGDPLPPCVDNGDQVAGNAYYCSTRDIIAWDDSTLIPDLERTYGELSVAIVFAHELGHAVQARTRMDGQTVTLEQQADCYAGAWVKRVKEGESDYFTMTTESLDRALGGFLEIADTPGTAAEDPNAHGSAFDRINSFQDGFEDGASKCARYDDQTVGSRLVEVPFQSVEDYQRGGNAPYGEIMDLTTKDLEDFWTKAGENTYGKAWTPLSSAKPFRGKDEAPECGDGDTEGYSLFYCSDGRFIAYDNVGLFPKVYQQVGDFGVSTLYATQYALAAQETFDLEGSSTKAKNLMADCLSGAWTGSVFSEDRGSDARLSLSPGDFDEAVKTLLLFGGKTASEVKTVGSGFERVSAFRNGVTGGLTACSK